MFDNSEKQHKQKLEAVVQLVDGAEILGVFFVAPQGRFTDLLNDTREFLPIESTSGAITVVRKAAILRVTPIKQDETLESSNPYTLLGIMSSVTQEELRAAYHRLVRQYHPDHLTSLGLPQPFIDFATGHMARINDAHQRVCRDKGFSAESENKAPILA